MHNLGFQRKRRGKENEFRMEKPETQRAGRLPGSPPNLETGLTAAQVQTRIAQGLVNADDGIKTKTEKQIILENTFTFFNILNFVLALFVLLVGSFKNLLFLGVIFSNTIIGSFQGRVL